VSDPAATGTPPPSRTASWRATVIAGVVLVAAAGGAAWSQRSPADPPSTPSVTPGGTGAVERDTRAASAVAAVASAWDDRARGRFLRAFATTDAARSWAASLYRNLQLLGVRDLSLRYVAERDSDPASAGPLEVFAGDVEVAWTPGQRSGLASRPTSPVTVVMHFADDGQRVALVETGPGSDALPVWLAGRLELVRLPGAVCLGVGRSHLSEMSGATRRAVADVEDVLGPVRPVVVVVPADGPTAAEVLGAAPSDVERIAAITTTIDGTTAPQAQVHVVVNPPVYDALGRRGARVVLTHEATHAVTGAATSPMPLWVAEGFADYVSLHDGDVPLEVAAGQILAQVRREGPPRTLPAPDDFATSSPGLGATYESAWLVFRMLAGRYGDAATIAFYERVRDGVPLDRALETELGLNRQRLTASWRAYLERLAVA